MKKTFFLVISIAILFLSACSSGGITNIDKKEVDEILSSGNGYLLIDFDNDSKYLHDVKTVSEENSVEVTSYDPHYADGKNKNRDGGRPIRPEENVEVNALYYIEDGEIEQELLLDYYEGTERIREIEKILKWGRWIFQWVMKKL